MTAVLIPGKENTLADYMSRSLNDNRKWQLAPLIFKNIAHFLSFALTYLRHI